jgi:hypothetical protein
MPRLAPDGQRCKENRITFGTSERKMMALMIKENRKNRIQKYVSSFALPIGVVAVGGGIALAGYFMAPGILKEIQEKIAEVKKNFVNLSDTVAGRKPTNPETGESGGIQTALCVEGPSMGNVVCNQAAGIPIIGGLLGWVNNFITTANALGDNVWVGVWGNFNKGARTIDELTEGWYFIDVTTGGPLY